MGVCPWRAPCPAPFPGAVPAPSSTLASPLSSPPLCTLTARPHRLWICTDACVFSRHAKIRISVIETRSAAGATLHARPSVVPGTRRSLGLGHRRCQISEQGAAHAHPQPHPSVRPAAKRARRRLRSQPRRPASTTWAARVHLRGAAWWVVRPAAASSRSRLRRSSRCWHGLPPTPPAPTAITGSATAAVAVAVAVGVSTRMSTRTRMRQASGPRGAGSASTTVDTRAGRRGRRGRAGPKDGQPRPAWHVRVAWTVARVGRGRIRRRSDDERR
jgi:hypothetical protein